MKKHYIFQEELKYISDENIREWTKENLNLLPDYFWVVPASSTGKYHPSYTVCEGGLVNHVKGATRIAIELFECRAMFPNLTEYDKSCILSAVILHDCMKSGTQKEFEKNKYTKHEHPLLAVKFLKQNYLNGVNQISKETFKVICKMIASHMGCWNTNPRSSVTLPTPQTEQEKFVHLVDYLASRKCLELNFDARLSY